MSSLTSDIIEAIINAATQPRPTLSFPLFSIPTPPPSVRSNSPTPVSVRPSSTDSVHELVKLIFNTACRTDPFRDSDRILSSTQFYNLYSMENAPDLRNTYFVQGLRNMHKYFDAEKGRSTQAPPPSPAEDIHDAEQELEKIILTQAKGSVQHRDLLPDPIATKDRYGFYTSGSNDEDVLNNIRQRRDALKGKDGQILGFDFPLLLAIYWLFDRKNTKITCMTSEVQRIMSDTGFSKEAAARFMSYFPLQFNDKVCRLLATHRRMRCFDLMYFVNSGEVKYNGDLLVRLFWGDRYLTNDSALGQICLRFTQNARQLLGTFLLQLGGVIATSLGRLRHIRSRNDDPFIPTLHDAIRVLQCFRAPAYNTREMGEQTTGFNTDYCDGFNLVSEVLKISMAEMEIYIEHSRVQNGATQASAHSEKISAKDVLPFLPRLLATTLEELYAYLYAACEQMPSVQEFSRICFEEGNHFIPLFRRRYDIPVPTHVIEENDNLEPVLQQARIQDLLQRVSTGEPVMGAEMRRSPTSMTPLVKTSTWFRRPAVHYEMNDLNARGRFPGTLPHRTYPMTDTGLSGTKEDVPLVFIDGDADENREDGLFWFRQDLASFMGKKAGNAPVRNVLAVPNPLLLRNNDTEWLDEDYNLEEPPMPRLLLKGNLKEEIESNNTSRRRQASQSSTSALVPRPIPVRDDDPPPYWSQIQNFLEPIPDGGELERFNEDIMDSDNEWEYFDQEARTPNPVPLASIGDRMADLYQEVLSWDVDTEDQGVPGHLFGSAYTNRYWLNHFFDDQHFGRYMMSDVTHAEDPVQYKDHMLAFICLTIRANIRYAIEANDELDEFRNQPQQFMDQAHDLLSIPMFTRVDVTQLVSSPGLFHMRATSTNLEHNRHIIDSLRGFTVCLAFLETPSGEPQTDPRRVARQRKRAKIRRKQAFSNVFLLLIRKVHITGDNQDSLGRQTDPETLHLTMSLSKKTMRTQHYVPQEGHILHFLPLCSMAAELRMFKAIHLLPTLPDSFRTMLHGSRQITIENDGLNVLKPVTRSTLTHQMVQAPPPASAPQVRAMVRRQVDSGSLNYLIRCLHHPNCQVDNSNFNAIVQALRTISNGEPQSSGAFCIQGPPGTGKTTNILYLIGALLHHSLYGHVGRPQLNCLGLEDSTLRASDRNDAFKILVVASSNAAVDNVLDRINRYGVPNGRGGVIRPSMLRIARWDYEHLPHLQRYELRTAATRFDNNWRERNTPSLRARRRCAQEAIVFFTTCSSAGGSGFKELEQHVDIVIHDEGANTTEPEVLVALTAATMRNMDRDVQRPNRLFYISVGDQRQLPALSHVPEMIREARLEGRLLFAPSSLSKSMFERLIDHNRVGHYFLASQYRMHPTISRITSPPFYHVYFQNPLNLDLFQTEYNHRPLLRAAPSGHPTAPFPPMTFIDTSHIHNRFEVAEAKGNIYNTVEARIITELVDTLFDMCHPGMLDSNIAIIAPYARQVREIRSILHQESSALRLPGDRAERNVIVCTVDSMQGSEASVVIFSATRSNKDRKTGFVKDPRRLNVSVSRAKFLNIIVGDISTIDGTGLSTPNRGIDPLKKIYDWCATEKEPGARLATVHYNRNPNVDSDFSLQYRDPLPSETPASSTRSRAVSTSRTTNVDTVEATPNYTFASLFPQQDDDDEIQPQ